MRPAAAARKSLRRQLRITPFTVSITKSSSPWFRTSTFKGLHTNTWRALHPAHPKSPVSRQSPHDFSLKPAPVYFQGLSAQHKTAFSENSRVPRKTLLTAQTRPGMF